MNVIIVGCGNVGCTLVENLRNEKHNIVIVDKEEEKIREVTDEQDVLGVVGDGVSYQTLLEAGIEHTDLLIAVTNSDEQNLLCCVMAKRSGRFCRTIARVRNPIYNTEISYLRRELGLALIINPELIASAEIARHFQYPDKVRVDTFTRGHIELLHLTVEEGSVLVGMAVRNIQSRFKCKVLICMIQRGRKAFVPGYDDTIEVGDDLVISATPSDANIFFRKTGIFKHPPRSAMIIGGGTVGFYLAKRLTEVGIRTKIIEIDESRCVFLNEQIPKATVIHGDGGDERLLLREGIGGVESFAALTGIDEENVLLTLFAKRVSHAKMNVKLRRLNYSNAVGNIQLDQVVFPSLLTADYITKYARTMSHMSDGNIENVFQLEHGRARAFEFFIRESNAVTGIPISQLNLKKDLIIASITRDEKVIIPTGREEIKVGDNVLVLSVKGQFEDINQIPEA